MLRIPEFRPVPVSMLQSRAREFEFEQLQAVPAAERKYHEIRQVIAEAIGWGKVLHEFKFPLVFSWDEDQAPARVMDQLVGQTINRGMTVKFRGHDFLVVDLDIRSDELGQVLTAGHLERCWRAITIVPLAYIDLES